jgi:hypothetical protein
MSKFRSRLARYNTNCCQQIMPVPVIPICAISCCMPRPICEYKEVPYYPPPPPPEPPQPCAISDKAAENGIVNAHGQTSPIQIPNYCPTLPPPLTGSILTITTDTIPSGYLAADGTEVSRTVYNNLFLAIGTYYGDGDGVLTFNLPNLSYDGTSCIVSYIIKT